MKKIEYLKPKIELLLVETEHGVANGSNTYLEMVPNSNSIDVEDWINGDGFETNEYFDYK